jgi:ATP-dependent DNA helicase RecQ
VPDFAARVAQALGVPFYGVIRKTCETNPQKEMENSVHQCRNLDGVFAVDRASVLAGPVLLVDDVVDSGWTLSVAAALLRAAGSGEVFPFALASASPE